MARKVATMSKNGQNVHILRKYPEMVKNVISNDARNFVKLYSETGLETNLCENRAQRSLKSTLWVKNGHNRILY